MPQADLTTVGAPQTRRRARRRTRARVNPTLGTRTGAGTGIGGGTNAGAGVMSSEFGKLSAREQLISNRSAEAVCHFYGLPLPWTGKITR